MDGVDICPAGGGHVWRETDEDWRDGRPVQVLRCKRCGTCASMDTTLPGCVTGQIGRCIDPTARSYYLKPENTRANDFLPEGDPAKYPEGGSWHYVDRDSCACDKHRSRGRL